MELLKEKKEIEKIKKIYFLIHPGYNTDDRNYNYFDADTREKIKDKHLILGERYIEKAKKLNRDELMFLFSHGKNFKEDIKNKKYQYTEIIKEIKNILGRRLIVLSGKSDVLYDKDIFNKIKQIANNRGFDFDQNVFSEAYGEILSCCVGKGAENLNLGGRFTRKTRINSKLTDASIDRYNPETLGFVRSERRRLKIR